MKLLFCHDGPMDIDKYGNAYPQSFTDEVFQRYYVIANEIIYLTRTKTIDPMKTQKKMVNMEKLRITSSPNLASLKGKFLNKNKAKTILKKEMQECDIVITRLPSNIGNLAIDMALKMKKPYLVELVACPWDAYWNHSIKGKLVAPYMYYETKKRVENASHVVYVTNAFLQKRYPTTGDKTNCSNVALTDFEDNVLNLRLEKISKMSKGGKIVIGTTAAVNVKYKGQQYIIEALGKLKKAGITNFEYQLVGGGDQSFLRSVAQKHDVINQVEFLGSMPHKLVFDWLDSIDLYIQPSRQEGLPRALIEAMSRGLPAFGAKTAGIPELLDSKFIFSNSNKNTEEIIKVLKSFDKEVLQEQAIRNYSEAQKYSKEVIEKRRSRFFQEFVKTYYPLQGKYK